MNLHDMELQLGFRVTTSGIEMLEGDGTVRAVQPNLQREHALRLWALMLEALSAADMRKRETEHWKSEGFSQKERADAAELKLHELYEERDRGGAIDAHSVLDSFGKPDLKDLL